MSTRNWTLGGFGLAVAALAALSVTACDPYIAENTAQPQVIGVTMVDTNYTEWYQYNYDGCTAPYPEPDQAWANSVYPGLCNPDNIDFGIPTVCPVACFPPRIGPAYAPFFLGNLGGSYQTVGGGTYSYALPTAWNLVGAPVSYIDPTEQEFNYGQIRILFNKLMDPTSIQPNPLSCLPATGATPNITVTADGVDVTATHSGLLHPELGHRVLGWQHRGHRSGRLAQPEHAVPGPGHGLRPAGQHGERRRARGHGAGHRRHDGGHPRAPQVADDCRRASGPGSE